jgi:hypothetical protein
MTDFEYWYDEYVERISIRMSEGKMSHQMAKSETFAEISDRMHKYGLLPHERMGMLGDIKQKAVDEGVLDEY